MGVMRGERAGGAGLVASMLVGVALGASGCASSGSGRPSDHAVPLSRFVAAANAQNHGNPEFTVAGRQHDVAMSKSTAFRAVISGCNEGPGTRLLVAGLVRGPARAGSRLYWAVFVDPPGKHLAPSSRPLPHPVVLNWVGGFVSVTSTQEPFCDFGHADDLPLLPVFTKRQ